MFAREESLPRRRASSSRRRSVGRPAAEALEPRALMAYSPLGVSLPDLAVTSVFSGPVAAYGGQIAVTVEVSNLGAASLVEPLNLAPGNPGATLSTPTTADVYLTRTRHARPGTGVFLGTIDIPAIPQNRLAQITGTLDMPATPPRRFPDSGSEVFLNVVVDPDRESRDFDRTNNFLRRGTAVFLTPNLPQLQTTALALPEGLRAGDAVIPAVKVANFGSAPTDLQAPLIVQVVASLDENFGPGDQVLAEYTVDNLEPLSLAPTKRVVLGDVTLDDPDNVVTLTNDDAVLLPGFPKEYFVGVVVDPLNQIREIDELDRLPSPRLDEVQRVQPNGLGLPPADQISTPNPADNLFPNPPDVSSDETGAFGLEAARAATFAALGTEDAPRRGAFRAAWLRAMRARRAGH